MAQWQSFASFLCFDIFQLDAKRPSLEVYQKYIDQELCDGDPTRIQCICERAVQVQDNCLHVPLWSLYTSFLVSILCDGGPARIQYFCERAVQDNYLHAPRWSLYTSFLVYLVLL